MDFAITSYLGSGNKTALQDLFNIKNLEVTDGAIRFDFSKYYECNPFNNLIIAQTLKNFKKQHPEIETCFRPCSSESTNSYLQHLGFYSFFGADYGKPLGKAQANHKYVPLTSIKFQNDFYGSIVKYAEQLSALLSFDKDLYSFCKYIFIEIIRNIYEHAQTQEAYMSAQYWGTYNLVEIAIIDAGRGISNALNPIYKNKTEQELLRMSTLPGISAKSNHSFLDAEDGWRNSGYGLYVLRRLAVEYGGSFMLCSNNYCDFYTEEGITNYKTFYPGTAIAIRFRTDMHLKFENIRRRIVCEGTKEAKDIRGAIKSASKSSGGHY
ncbi:MAG: hypothetical protein E7678_04865 [Ruminococcaceae bacterium]|nr:hypothetical protein [Oscillospiraceae bacterium]